MHSHKTYGPVTLLVVLLILLATGCSNGSGSEELEPAPQATGAGMSQIRAFETRDAGEVDLPGEDLEGADQSQSSRVGGLSLSWATEKVGEGIKPAVAVDANGVVHVAWLTELDHGRVYYANNRGGSFSLETVAEGYFYGPLDLALGPGGTPYIAYHDHQATGFDPSLGDAVVAVQGDVWELATVSDDGHDGWDNSIAVDADGNWHQASIDPSQFGGANGVEYSTNKGGDISVTPVGGPPVSYEFGTSIALDGAGVPGVAYYDDMAQALLYARLGEAGWAVEVVDGDGDAGRYASLVYDLDDNPHISYFVLGSQNAGLVRHAWKDGSTWQSEVVGTLDSVQMGMVGARKVTALALDGEGGLHVAYSDADSLVYGRREDGAWLTQEVPHSGDPLGQLVELALDAEGHPHLVWFEVTATSPALNGDIIHAAGS